MRRNLRLHPSVGISAFDHNLASLWLAHRQEAPPGEFEITEVPEYLLIVRSGLEVGCMIITAASYAFLEACQAGESVLTAAGRALAADPGASLPDIVRTHLVGGVFTSLTEKRPGSAHDD
jgi:hypothetical protein